MSGSSEMAKLSNDLQDFLLTPGIKQLSIVSTHLDGKGC